MTPATPVADSLASGTSYQGEVQATLRTMIKIFGEPNSVGSDKTTCEWTLQFENGTIATVYDWKRDEYGIGEIDLDARVDWTIGGFDNDAYEQVRRAVRLG